MKRHIRNTHPSMSLVSLRPNRKQLKRINMLSCACFLLCIIVLLIPGTFKHPDNHSIPHNPSHV